MAVSSTAMTGGTDGSLAMMVGGLEAALPEIRFADFWFHGVLAPVLGSGALRSLSFQAKSAIF